MPQEGPEVAGGLRIMKAGDTEFRTAEELREYEKKKKADEEEQGKAMFEDTAVPRKVHQGD